jgi:hypothetical protein
MVRRRKVPSPGEEWEKGDVSCAKKLGKGESDVRNITETFCRNPAGRQSRLVERPAARSESCVLCGQPSGRSVDSECRSRAIEPRNYRIVGALVVMRAGAAPTTLYGLTCRSRRGQRTGHKHIRVPQELGTPCRFHLFIDWLTGEVPDPKLPGPKSASDLVGGTKTGARGGHRHAKETKCDGTGGRESEHLIVPSNRENVTLRIPGREGGAGSGVCWRETCRVHRNPIPCSRNNNR